MNAPSLLLAVTAAGLLSACGGDPAPAADPPTASPTATVASSPSDTGTSGAATPAISGAVPPSGGSATSPAASGSASPAGSGPTASNSPPVDPRAPLVEYEVSGGLVAQTRRVTIRGDGTVEVTASGAVATASAAPRRLSTKELKDLTKALDVAKLTGQDLRQGDGCCDRTSYALTYRGLTTRGFDAPPGAIGTVTRRVEALGAR